MPSPLKEEFPSTPPSEERRDRPWDEVETRPQKKLGRWIVLAAVLLLAGIFWKSHARSEGEAAGSRGGPQHAAAVPVVVGSAEARDFPIYLSGLGTVQAYNSVVVKARVDGEIQQIFFTEGQTVQKGDKLVQIDPRTYQSQLDQAKAKKAQDDAQLNNARTNLARNDKLMKNSVIDQQTYDAQKYAADQFQALVAADQAAIDNAQTLLDYTNITAPIAGRVGIRLVDAGNIVHPNDTTGIVVINQVQPISVVFTLPQQELGEIREALLQQKTLTVQALDRDNLSVLSEGQIEVLDNQIDPTTATVKLKAVFANTDYKLWPGQFVNVRLLLGTKQNAVVVAAQAVERGPNGTYVYLVGSNQTVEMKTVTTGDTESGQTLITEGLQAGDRVVVDGQYKLQPGAKINVTKDLDAGKDESPDPAK